MAQLGLWALVTLLGLLIAVVAGLKHGHGTATIIAGAAVATFTTLTNTLHPGS